MDADLLKLVIFPAAFLALMAIIKIGGLFVRKSEPHDWTDGNSLVTTRLAAYDDAGGRPEGMLRDVSAAGVNLVDGDDLTINPVTGLPTYTINPATNLPMVSAAFDVAGSPFGCPPPLHAAHFDGD